MNTEKVEKWKSEGYNHAMYDHVIIMKMSFNFKKEKLNGARSDKYSNFKEYNLIYTKGIVNMIKTVLRIHKDSQNKATLLW